jgi:hypothetical protein
MNLKETLKYMTEADDGKNLQTNNTQATQNGETNPAEDKTKNQGGEKPKDNKNNDNQKPKQNQEQKGNKKELFENFSKLIKEVEEAYKNLEGINNIISKHQGWQQFKNGNTFRGVTRQGKLINNKVNNLGNAESLNNSQKAQIDSIDNKGDIQTIFINQFALLKQGIEKHLKSMIAASNEMKNKLGQANNEQAKDLNNKAQATSSKALNDAGVVKNQNSANQGGNQNQNSTN